MIPPGLTIRRGGVADAAAMARQVADAFEDYRSWAPIGWRPPDVTGPAGMARLLERMHDPRSWSLVALEPDGGLAGHILFWPARDDDGGEVEGVAGIVDLFVAPAWFGRGLAADLLARAVAEMHRQGYRATRLWTPAGQRRARAFYAREGWSPTGREMFDQGLGLALLELGRELRTVAAGGAR
jgi:GNAT superfamily N-acetyltransferase